MADLLTTQDVATRTGQTYLRIDRWERRGWIVAVVAAEGSGTIRLFHPSVVDRVAELVGAVEACPHVHSGRDASAASLAAKIRWAKEKANL